MIVDHFTIVRETVNRVGDVVGDPVLIPVPEAIVAPDTSVEPARDRAMTVTRRKVFAVPSGTDIRATDHLLIPGDPAHWHVIGDAQDWAHPFVDWDPGQELLIERITG